MDSLDIRSKIAYRMMYCIAGIFIIVSFLISTVEDLIVGMKHIAFASDILITDYIEIAGIGAAFFNAGCVTLITLLLMRIFKIPMHGGGIAVVSLMAGFSLFGKNIINMWFMFPGTLAYAWCKKEPFSKYLLVSLMSSSLGPLISTLLFGNGFSRESFLAALTAGFIIGFVAPPLCVHTDKILRGLSLYNGGFAIGLIAMVLGSVVKNFGVPITPVLHWYTGDNFIFAIGLYTISICSIAYALIHSPKKVIAHYRILLKRPGVPSDDFTELDGMEATCLNIGINLIFSTTLLLLAGGDLNGPTIGGLLTIVGFSAKGKHIKNIAPIMFGVLFGFWLTSFGPLTPAAQLALLFSTTLAPIAGTYGTVIGFIAGVLHSCVAFYAGAGYSGINLYNNGYAGGIVSIVMYAVISNFRNPNTFSEPSINVLTQASEPEEIIYADEAPSEMEDAL